MITKIVALLAVFAMSLTISVLTMVFGYGVLPKSWTAIVLLGFVGQIFVHGVARKILDEDKK